MRQHDDSRVNFNGKLPCIGTRKGGKEEDLQHQGLQHQDLQHQDTKLALAGAPVEVNDSPLSTPSKKNLSLCAFFTSTGIGAPHHHGADPGRADKYSGICLRANECPRRHDYTKTAICRSVLTGAECLPRHACRLQHSPLPEVLPTCLFFLQGQCVRSSCIYSHAPVLPSNMFCRYFDQLGYCNRGFNCGLIHLRLCLSPAKKDKCTKSWCSLLHEQQSGAAALSGKAPTMSRSQEEPLMGSNTSDFSDQKDYISLE